MKHPRTLLALMSAATLTVSLIGCSADAEPDGGAGDTGTKGDLCALPGDASKAVEIDGEFGSAEIRFTSTTPVEGLGDDALQRSVLIDGDGEQLQPGDAVNFHMTEINGVNGETLRSYSQPMDYNPDSLPEWFTGLVDCAAFGDRVVGVLPVAQAAGEGGGASMGMADTDPLVFVFDISKQPGTLEHGEVLSKAEGQAQPINPALPSVVLAEDGSPTITMPEGVAAPEKLTVETLIRGEGEPVLAGDRVYVHYRGVIWRTGEEFDSSWSRGEYTNFLTSGVIGGFAQALIGQTVGSQVISIVPAEDGGYGAAALQSQGHEPDDVMVFVLDILGTVHAQ